MTREPPEKQLIWLEPSCREGFGGWCQRLTTVGNGWTQPRELSRGLGSNQVNQFLVSNFCMSAGWGAGCSNRQKPVVAKVPTETTTEAWAPVPPPGGWRCSNRQNLVVIWVPTVSTVFCSEGPASGSRPCGLREEASLVKGCELLAGGFDFGG